MITNACGHGQHHVCDGEIWDHTRCQGPSCCTNHWHNKGQHYERIGKCDCTCHAKSFGVCTG